MLGYVVGAFARDRYKERKRAAEIEAEAKRLAANKFYGDNELESAMGQLEAGNWAPLQSLLETRPYPPRDEALDSKADIDIFRRWAAETDSCIAYSQLAQAHIRDGWAARGQGRTDTVTDDGWGTFFDQLHQAEAACATAIERDPSSDFPWSVLLTTARGLQHPKDELRYRFAQAQERRPFARDSCRQMLQGLCAKWSGSHEAMFEFARWINTEAPSNSPARGAIGTAHQEMQIDGAAGWLARPEVSAEVGAALDAYLQAVPSDPSQLRVQELMAIDTLLASLRPQTAKEASVAVEGLRRLDDRPASGWLYFGGEVGYLTLKAEWEKSLPKLIKKGA